MPATTPRKALALTTLTLAGALLGGCGESNKTPAAASATTSAPAATATATDPTGAGTAPTKDQATSSTPAAHYGRSALAKARAREAFQSLANAKPAPKPTPQQRAQRPISDIQLTSPDIDPTTNTLNTANTCYGANQHPTLRWKNIPPGTAEIAILIISTKPVNNKLFYNWAITGINPNTHEIPAGQTPPGTTTGQNSNGQPTYTICPPPHTHETYAIIIYAIPTTTHPTPNFNPNTLRNQTKQTTHHTGLLITTYQHT
jgi:phosphatidylethanolamine-binding protein (PEBP) family uncharacterized protein